MNEQEHRFYVHKATGHLPKEPKGEIIGYCLEYNHLPIRQVMAEYRYCQQQKKDILSLNGRFYNKDLFYIRTIYKKKLK